MACDLTSAPTDDLLYEVLRRFTRDVPFLRQKVDELLRQLDAIVNRPGFTKLQGLGIAAAAYPAITSMQHEIDAALADPKGAIQRCPDAGLYNAIKVHLSHELPMNSTPPTPPISPAPPALDTRDSFALMAVLDVLRREGPAEIVRTNALPLLATLAYGIADEMLAARARTAPAGSTS